MIKKLPHHNLWRLYSHEGKNLGTFSSEELAEEHERQIEYFKKKKKVLY